MLEQYGKEIEKYRLLTRAEENALGARAAAGDKEAQDKLVSHNLRLVLQIAHTMRRRMDATFSEMVSAGNQGLVDAARKFDPSKGAKFSTYASWWIKQRMRRDAAGYGVVRVNPKEYADKRRAREASRRLGTTDPAVLARELGVHASRVPSLLEEYREVRLNARTKFGSSGDDGAELMDVIAVDPGEAEARERDSSIRAMMDLIEDRKFLDEREREIIKGRFGVDGEEQNLESLAARFHCTRERVRQIQMDVLRKLRAALAEG